MADGDAPAEFKMPSLPAKENVEKPTEQPLEEDAKEEPKLPPPPVPQKKSIIAPPFEYKPPPFAADPDDGAGYKFEVLKDGLIVDTIDFSNRKAASYLTIGRLPECDITLEHPSISRYHAILQYGNDHMGKGRAGWYVYDLGSTHGSKLNKNTLLAKEYQRLQVGMVLRFGGSTRIFNLVGPGDDAEPEWDCSPTEMKEQMKRKALEVKLAKQAREEYEREKAREREEEGCSWGMDYDESAGPSGLVVGEALEEHLMEDHEAYYSEAPIKSLQKFFDREGFDMEWVWSETGVNSHNHKWICSIELPVELGSQKSLIISATVSTSKKDGQVQCALEACRTLDAHGILRKSTAQSRLKRKTVADEDYYEDDEDEFLDRTGQIEAQRAKRKAWHEQGTGQKSTAVDSYESLQKKLEERRQEAAEVEKQLEPFRTAKHQEQQADDLDEYVKKMDSLGGGGMDLKAKTDKSILTQRLVKLRHDCQRLEKLVKIAKPVELPTLKRPDGTQGMSIAGSSQQAIFRKMMQMRKTQPGSEEAKKREDEDKKKKEHEEKEGDYNYELKFVGKSTDSAFNPEDDEDVDESKLKGPQLPPAKEEEKSTVSEGTVEKKEEEKAPKRSREEMEGENNEVVEKKAKVEEEEKEEEDLSPEAVKEEDEEETQKKKSRQRHRGERKEKEKEKLPDGGHDLTGEYGVGIADADETYATWMPPEQKESDAQRKLKEKFAGKY